MKLNINKKSFHENMLDATIVEQTFNAEKYQLKNALI